MQSHTVRSTILILALAVAGVPGAFAETAKIDRVKLPQDLEAAIEHYAQSDMANMPGPDGQLAPRLQNLGTHTFPVSTRNKLAQRYINQGLNLAYGFNHAEARRAFREAARLDPGTCDGLLGSGARARPQYQRNDGTERGATGSADHAAGQIAYGESLAQGAGAHQCP